MRALGESDDSMALHAKSSCGVHRLSPRLILRVSRLGRNLGNRNFECSWLSKARPCTDEPRANPQVIVLEGLVH